MAVLRWIMSAAFVFQMYLMMVVLGILFLPWALFERRGAYAAVRSYSNWVRWSARWMIGLRSEVRGKIPEGEVLIAAKHQSFFDAIMIVSAVQKPKFIMKHSLKYAPVLGWYGLRIGCICVERGKRAQAIKSMVAEVKSGKAPAGQLIIYPQGTRIAPGVSAPYKTGTAALYQETGQICVPAATNVGVFWPKYGILRQPGLAVVEFLPAIQPGFDNEEFMHRLEEVIEQSSNALLEEAAADRFYPLGRDT